MTDRPSVVTPSGVEIAFDPDKHKYTVNGERLPSVTTILGVLDKSRALTFWAERVTLEGMLSLAADGIEMPPDLAACIEALKARQLRHYQLRDSAGSRGDSVHEAAERLATVGEVPDLRDFPAEDRGYVQALCDWWLAHNPKVLATEVMVASVEHGYAGRFDLLCEIQGISHRIDFKTGKAVYEQAHFQAAAYEAAAAECGYPEATLSGILRLDESGSYEFVVARATFADFLAVKAAYDALKRVSRKPRKQKTAA